MEKRMKKQCAFDQHEAQRRNEHEPTTPEEACCLAARGTFTDDVTLYCHRRRLVDKLGNLW